MDTEELITQIDALVSQRLAEVTGPLLERISALEQQVLAGGPAPVVVRPVVNVQPAAPPPPPPAADFEFYMDSKGNIKGGTITPRSK